MNEIDLLPIVILMVTGTIVLILVLFLIRTLTTPEEEELTNARRSIIPEARRYEIDSDVARRPATRDVRPSPTGPPQPAVAPEQEADTGIKRITRKTIRVVPLDSQMRIEIDGQIYNSLEEILDEGTRALVQNTIRELEERREEIIETGSPEDFVEAVLKPLFGDQATKSPFQQVVVKKVDEPEPEPATFVDQIEALLQVRLSGDPNFMRRSIHIHQAPEGLWIEVDGRYYQGVDEVADPEVRALIQSVVREWEGHKD